MEGSLSVRKISSIHIKPVRVIINIIIVKNNGNLLSLIFNTINLTGNILSYVD